MLGLTATYLVAEVSGGLLTGSLALLADAGHMLTDLAGLALALVALTVAERPATPQRTFGYRRVEILAALINAVVLVLISLYVLFEAFERFRNPPPVEAGAMMIVAAVGLAVNFAGMMVLRSGSRESLNMKGAYFEVLSDMFTSIGVIAAGLVIWVTGWRYADPLASAGIGLFILPRTWGLLKDAVGVLMEGTPPEVDLEAVRGAIQGVEGVVGVHDLHAWALTSGANALSAHVVLVEGASFAAVLSAVHRRLRSGFPIGHVTIQVEPEGWERAETHP